MAININLDKCKLCKICEKSCATNSITVENQCVTVKDTCTLCGVCVNSCPFGALEMKKNQEASGDLNSYRDIWVYMEVSRGKIIPVGFELLGIGKKLAKEKNCRLVAILLNKNGNELAKEPIYHGADEVLLCTNETLTDLSEEAFVDIISQIVDIKKPETLLFGATSLGRSIAPRIAAKAKTGLTADCTVLEIDSETSLLRQTRPAFGGNIMATIICPNTRPQMSTVRPGVMQASDRDTTLKGSITKIPFNSKTKNHKIRILETNYEDNLNSIAKAKTLVVAGRGIGSKKNMKLVREFARSIGASVGVSRPLVDAGWGEYSEQVGQTGLVVAPKVLISLGISGAIQHIAGISQAEKIISINTDASAPIFNSSHYKIVGDCMEIIDEYLKVLK